MERLAAAVRRMPTPVFAVVDGGHFDDVRADLTTTGLDARSLFLGQGDRDTERHGPWLVSILRQEHVRALLDLVGDRPAVVFWSCAQGDVALFGHLRRLNMARLPAWAASGKDGPEPGSDADGAWEAVLFRHWDPRVLAALLPVLDEAQFSRIVGPADEIAFHDDDHGGSEHGRTRRVVADPAWPTAPVGMLTVFPDQIASLSDRRIEAKRFRLGAYLREVAADDLADMRETDVRDRVVAGEASAARLGIRTEAGQCRWLFLLHATRGQAGQSAPLAEFIRDQGRSPDEQVRLVMRKAALSLRRSGH